METNQTNLKTPEELYKERIQNLHSRLPQIQNPPTPNKTLICIPMMDGRIEWETAQALLYTIGSCWTGILTKCGTSLVQLARNELVNGFLRTPYEWLVFLDADIIFSKQDLEFLLEGTDYAVNAVYAQKDSASAPVTRGLGFARIHRSCFELLRDTEVAIPYEFKGHKCFDFFITGASATGGFLGEDSGFWWMLSQIGVIPRIETRVKLRHIGRQTYECSFNDIQNLNIRLREINKNA